MSDTTQVSFNGKEKVKLRSESWTAHTAMTPGRPWLVSPCWPIPHTVCAAAVAFSRKSIWMLSASAPSRDLYTLHGMSPQSHFFSLTPFLCPPSSLSMVRKRSQRDLKVLFYWTGKQEGILLLSSLSNGQCTWFSLEKMIGKVGQATVHNPWLVIHLDSRLHCSVL